MSPISTNLLQNELFPCARTATPVPSEKKSKTIAIMFRNTIVVPTSVRPGSSGSEDRIRQPLTTFSPTSMKPPNVGKNKPTFSIFITWLLTLLSLHRSLFTHGSIAILKNHHTNNHSLTTGCPSLHPILPLPLINNNYENPTSLHWTSSHHQPDYPTNHHPIIVLHFLEHLVWNNREIVLPLKCHTNHHHWILHHLPCWITLCLNRAWWSNREQKWKITKNDTFFSMATSWPITKWTRRRNQARQLKVKSFCLVSPLLNNKN